MTQLNSKVNPPVELENDGIVLNSGLDLITSNLQVDKGALRDCLNFEVVDRLGYQTLQGFDRYDGALSPDQAEFWVFEVPLGEALPSAGEVIYNNDLPTQYFGVVVDVQTALTTNYVVYARYSADTLVQSGGNVAALGPGVVVPFVASSTAQRYKDSGLYDPNTDNAETLFSLFETYNAVLRSRVSALSKSPIGLHWYRDRLYAICDEVQLAFQFGGMLEIKPNDIVISEDRSSFCGRVLDITLESGTWTGGNARGTMLIEPVEFFDGDSTVLISTVPTSGVFDLLNKIPEPSDWNDPGIDIQLTIFTARALVATDPVPSFAGLWRTKDEPDTGWQRIESGWRVPYEEGRDQFGELRRVERAIDNNFSYTSDSSDTTGSNGQLVTFFNGFPIPNIRLTGIRTEAQQQSPGWRDTNDLTVFATTDEALETTDSRFLQGDLAWGIRALTETGAPSAVPYFRGQPLIAGWDSPTYDAGAAYVWGANTGATTPRNAFQYAGNSDALTPLTFLNFGPIVGSLPARINITGLEVEVDYDVLSQFQSDRPNAESADFVPSTLASKFTLAAVIGEVNPETGNFDVKGSAETSTLGLPTTQAGYTYVDDTYPAGPEVTRSQAVYIGTGKTLTIGGITSTFGNNRLERDNFLKSNFGIAVYGTAGQGSPLTSPTGSTWQEGSEIPDAGGQIRYKLNRLRVKLYYTEPSARYYATDDFTAPTPNVCSFDLVNYSVLQGQLEDGNAKGVMQVVNIQQVPGFGFKSCLFGGDTIHQLDIGVDTLGADNQVAKVEGTTGAVAMSLNGFPSLSQIVEEGSRYQFITANFFAREDWDGFYGVSGAGKAFSFAAFDADDDGDEEQYIQFITTNTVVPDEDKPRHIAFHQYHLALGYRDGTVRFSVPGEPENYDGLAGAAEVGVGDRVTGLLSMKGKALGVFCDSSIYTILGDNADTFNVETLSPYAGAIEYTVVDNGGKPVYCDNRGISTLEHSDRYGNFAGYRISRKVSPWILPRMTRSDNLFDVSDAAGVVCAIPIRSKNQYRVFFRDGFFLIYTMMPDGSGAFTYGQYFLNEDRSQFFVPIAHSAQTDSTGRDRIHMAHYSPKSAISSAASKFAYEFDKGLGFDGSWYDAFFDTAFAYKDPFKDNTIRKVRFDYLTKGAGWYTITVAKDYDEDSYSTTLIPFTTPRVFPSTPYLDFKPGTSMVNVAKEGRSLSYRIQRDTSNKTLVPPTTFQVMLVHYQNGGKRDA